MNFFTQHLDALLLNRCSMSIMLGPDCSDDFKSFIIQKYEGDGYRYIALGSRTKASELVAIAVGNDDSVGIIVDNVDLMSPSITETLVEMIISGNIEFQIGEGSDAKTVTVSVDSINIISICAREINKEISKIVDILINRDITSKFTVGSLVEDNSQPQGDKAPYNVDPTGDMANEINENSHTSGDLSAIEDKIMERGLLSDTIGKVDVSLNVKFEFINPYDVDRSSLYVVLEIEDDGIDLESVDFDAAEEVGDYIRQKIGECAEAWPTRLKKFVDDDLSGVVLRINGSYFG